jgi:uncharacterized protein (DUF433 family)
MTYERIEVNRDIMDGKPVIRGTRVPVELVLRKLGAGMSPAAILADHPRLTHDDIRGAQAFAAIISPTKPLFTAEGALARGRMRRGTVGGVSARWRSRRALCRGICRGF